MGKRLTALALAALAALAVSGCDRRGGGQAADTKASASGSTAAASQANLATPETAGKPAFQLKFGQPASFAKGGVTITVVPKTLDPVDGVPAGLADDVFNCGSWWKLTYDLTVDAQADSTWKGWYVEFIGPSALQSMKTASSSYGGRYGDTYIRGGQPEDPASQGHFVSKAANDYTKDPKAAFQRSGAVVQYFATCVYNSETKQHLPSGKPPVGVVWNQELEKGQGMDKRPDVAVWTL
ncbi:hypothetical protein [Segniliparus rugosus]|uniref:Lipoprotein n=1 Tax=Segniliparus rugosus (strain ATCC BAA-974 / DSM 45345 / CCUG 50838 / CIP 108380 / JCM 13579 / CDC 945) TaxID=679197 RepID=E5XT46_SEGRC|nr:hypothetical protein [Segniliparus rugosus]EFV12457.1 hypothetical protein HMPREF9336_02668 [Segniliparus rugosus ATCC BAA-974]